MPQTYHGWATLHEIEILVTQCGLTPSEALVAATKISAEGLRGGTTTGTIEPGRTADLLLVNGNPEQDIKAIQNTSMTFLAGKPFDPRELEAAIRSPEQTPLPVHKIAALVDDEERTDGRTNLDTLAHRTNRCRSRPLAYCRHARRAPGQQPRPAGRRAIRPG
jgi:adenine deaminase